MYNKTLEFSNVYASNLLYKFTGALDCSKKEIEGAFSDRYSIILSDLPNGTESISLTVKVIAHKTYSLQAKVIANGSDIIKIDIEKHVQACNKDTTYRMLLRLLVEICSELDSL